MPGFTFSQSLIKILAPFFVEDKMSKHLFWMIAGCGSVLIFLFIAPKLGLNSGISTTIAIIAMLGCHLLMVRFHRNHSGQ